MGMSIDTAITVLGMVEAHGICIEAKDVAVETMRKYQKIKQIIDDWENSGEEDDPINIIDNIEEVLEDGNAN